MLRHRAIGAHLHQLAKQLLGVFFGLHPVLPLGLGLGLG